MTRRPTLQPRNYLASATSATLRLAGRCTPTPRGVQPSHLCKRGVVATRSNPKRPKGSALNPATHHLHPCTRSAEAARP